MIRRHLWMAVIVLAACGHSVAPGASDLGSSVTSATTATTLPTEVSTTAPTPFGVSVSLRTNDDIVALDDVGRLRYRAPDALMNPSHSRLISAIEADETTVVQTIDPADGRVLFSQTLEGEFVPVAMSTSGKRAAFAPAAYDPPAKGEIAVGRSTTTIVVVETDGSTAPQTITLDGNLVPEGFTREDNALAAIEFLPAEHPVEYRVRVIDLTQPGVLESPFGWLTKEPLDMTMVGVRGSHVLTNDGQFLYTLYRDTDGTAFVHSLGLDIGRQYCIDLPAALDLTLDGSGTTASIAATPDGAHLYVVTSKGMLAEILSSPMSNENPAVDRVVDLGTSGDGTPPAVTVTASTLYAALGDQLVAVDLASLKPTRTPLAAPASALVVEPRNGTVYASGAERIWAVGAVSGSVLTLPAGIGAVSELYLG